MSSIKAEDVSQLEDVKLEAAATAAASGSVATADIVLGEAQSLPFEVAPSASSSAPTMAAAVVVGMAPAEEGDFSGRLKSLFA